MPRPTAVIFDVDGTLCDVSTVRHHVRGPRRNFDAFHAASLACPPNAEVAEAARRASRDGHAVLVVTGRAARWARPTGFWLALHDIPSDGLFTRDEHDQRSDVAVKTDILALIRRRYDVVAAYDDNPSVIALWKSYGIPVHTVAGWDEED
ncbi:hypothetical protein [Mumia sp. DW29H23]|uniref:phosphatase domain-containing protein n=1 Tax=Mumia sp. DW29H23 TaxID=3421241 RepID=UPI003D6916B8